jgi:hypothetical protein
MVIIDVLRSVVRSLRPFELRRNRRRNDTSAGSRSH